MYIQMASIDVIAITFWHMIKSVLWATEWIEKWSSYIHFFSKIITCKE